MDATNCNFHLVHLSSIYQVLSQISVDSNPSIQFTGPIFFLFHCLKNLTDSCVPFIRYPAVMAVRQSGSSERQIEAVLPHFLYRCGDRFLPRESGVVDRVGSITRASKRWNVEENSMICSPREPTTTPIQMYSPEYYAACAVGGVLACGLTHAAMTPLDVVKCNMQISPSKYTSISRSFGHVFREGGARGLLRGWAPTLIGYSLQGANKYGFYEFFKKYYADLAGPERAQKHKTLVYLAGSASAEFIADVALCPFEAVKVRIQTQQGYARGLTDGLPKIWAQEGLYGLYKGIGPLWARQVPYAMMKFATFESTVDALYQHVVPKPKAECSNLEQLGVSFVGGYVGGIACAVISHPADNLVSFLNSSKGATVSEAVKKMGLVALITRGLPLRIVMIGTLSGLQWSIYDAFKLSVGLDTTSGISTNVNTH